MSSRRSQHRGSWAAVVVLAVLAACNSETGSSPTGTGGGAAGASGSAGTSGDAGTSGSAGTTSSAATTGTAGTIGGAGTTGSAGTSGGAGSVGVAGTTGAAGASGGAGRGGATGSAGRGGTTGSAGATAGAGGRGGTKGVAGASGGRGGSSGAGGGSAGGGGTTGAAGAGTQPYKGLASYNGCTDLAVLNTSWYYTWNASTNCTSSAQFVPQIWGHSGENIASEITAAANKGYPYVLGFNEPDNTGQSNMTVAAAIGLWPQLTTNKALLVGSPATQGNSTGLTWLTQFMTMANADTTGTLRVDFIAMHWYGWNSGSCEPSAATLENFLKQVEAIPGNRPIWITEWGCLNVSAPTSAGVQSFLSGAITMLAKHPRVVRYGWFESRTSDPNTTLVNSDGTLTALGTIYAGAPATK
jgi:hypothetical protein